MTVFDEVLMQLQQVLGQEGELLRQLGSLIVNRDLNGRIRLIASAEVEQEAETVTKLESVAARLADELAPHAFEAGQMILYEEDLKAVSDEGQAFPLEDVDGVTVVDRLASEARWGSIEPVSEGVPRIAFFSIKGGVGRSTAMAVTAWSLAQAGKRVMVLDLDLESPGLSSGLLPEERRPAYGITDWLVEDLVNNGDAVIDDMIATSELSHDGEIIVVPAHGAEAGDYIAKLGRVWMPKVTRDGNREDWSRRLGRLLDQLESRVQPDVILIDSRSGIDEVASSCVTDLGAGLVLLFAIDGEQTWSGYRILLDYWSRSGAVRSIRERLQLVGAMVPELGAADYFDGLRERGWDLFSETLYDMVPPGQTSEALWSFDDHDESAPHYPWSLKWHRSFAALTSLHGRVEQLDPAEVASLFGPLVTGVSDYVQIHGEGE